MPRAFGTRQDNQKAATPPVDEDAVSSTQFAFMVASFIAIGIFVPLYMWIGVYQVPIEQPYAGLFAKQQIQEGWAPIWVPPLVVAVVGLLGAILVCRRFTPLDPVKAGISALAFTLLSAILTGLIKNIGFTILYVPGATLTFILGAIPQMFLFHTSKGVFDVATVAPELTAIPLVVGVIYAFLK